jgi:hypothetical protein
LLGISDLSGRFDSKQTEPDCQRGPEKSCRRVGYHMQVQVVLKNVLSGLKNSRLHDNVQSRRWDLWEGFSRSRWSRCRYKQRI